MSYFNLIFVVITAILLFISFFKDKEKTKNALIKGIKSLIHIMPEFLTIIILVGIMLGVMDEKLISKLIGSQSGVLGVVISAVIGAITLIPGFVAFPTAAILINNGAGYYQIGTFISSLMMVGVVTLPLEIKFFSKKTAFLRNILAFIFSFIVGYIIYLVLKGS